MKFKFGTRTWRFSKIPYFCEDSLGGGLLKWVISSRTARSTFELSRTFSSWIWTFGLKILIGFSWNYRNLFSKHSSNFSKLFLLIPKLTLPTFLGEPKLKHWKDFRKEQLSGGRIKSKFKSMNQPNSSSWNFSGSSTVKWIIPKLRKFRYFSAIAEFAVLIAWLGSFRISLSLSCSR